MKHTPYIAIIILLVVILILENKNHRLEKQKFLSKEHDFEFKLQQTESELRRSLMERDSLHLISDSLLRNSTDLKLKLDKTNLKLQAIKGRYNQVSVDSLSKLMEHRATNKK